MPGAQGHEGGPRGVAGAGDEPQVCGDRQSDARLGDPQECQPGSFGNMKLRLKAWYTPLL